MNKVIFIEGKNFSKIEKALNQFSFKEFRKRNVMIKLHMGELGNKSFLKPDVVKIFVDELKNIQSIPFLFDTISRHPSRCTKEKYLDTASNKHGFSSVGCPIVIGDKGSKIKIDDFEFEVAKEFVDTENIIVLSHAKGHVCSGFGGAIKNLGMGAASAKSKLEMHEWGKPIFDRNLCTKCNQCAEVCPLNLIKIDDEWSFDEKKCLGCGKCVVICSNKSLKYKADLQDSLARMAKASITDKKTIYINMMVDITKWCDCANNDIFPYEIICDDIGILVSDDPVAIDAASIDLIEDKMGKKFMDVWNVEARNQLKKAEQLDMGSMKYNLVKI